eukprot:1154946-Pelagomonas_calceolata.AAC.1
MRIRRDVGRPSRLASRPPVSSPSSTPTPQSPIAWIAESDGIQAYRGVNQRVESLASSGSTMMASGQLIVFWGAVQMGTSIRECFFEPHQELPSLKGRAYLYHASIVTKLSPRSPLLISSPPGVRTLPALIKEKEKEKKERRRKKKKERKNYAKETHQLKEP